MIFKKIQQNIINLREINEITRKTHDILTAKKGFSEIDPQYLQKNKFFLIRKFNVDDNSLIFPNNKKLFFLHIPKTGGSTFVKSFLALFEKSVGNIKTIESGQGVLFNMSQDQKDQYNSSSEKLFFHGHYPYGAHKHAGFLDDEVSYFAVVRNPVSHILSMYNWLYQRLVISSDIDFDSFIKCTNNIQTKLLAGVTVFNAEQNHAHNCFFDNSEINQEVFDKAIHNIENHFSLVGTTETLSDFMKICVTKFGWCDIITHSKNEGKVKILKELTPKQISEVERINSWDVKLHQYVTERFKKIIDNIYEINRKSLSETIKMNLEDWEDDWAEDREIIVAGNASVDGDIIPTKIKFGALRHYYAASIINRYW